MTAHKIEELEAIRRKSQAKQSDLMNYISDGEKQAHAANNELKVNQTRRSNVLARIAAENMVAERVEQGEKDVKLQALISQQNSRLATEISLRNAEEERMEREIQRMCETSEELKELEKKLNIAYVNKERAAQHQEAALLNKLEDAREVSAFIVCELLYVNISNKQTKTNPTPSLTRRQSKTRWSTNASYSSRRRWTRRPSEGAR